MQQGGAPAEPAAISALRVPSSAQRRVDQCIVLSRDLLAAQGRAETAESGMAKAKADAARTLALLADAERRLRMAGQPQSYLADQVERADAQRLAAEGKLASAEQVYGP